MKSYVQVGLSFNWKVVKKHLPRSLVKRLSDSQCQERGDYVYCHFPKSNSLWKELVERNKTIGDRDLIRLVRHINEYEFADLISCSHLQLEIQNQVALLQPVAQYYRFDVVCAECGRINRVQINPLKIFDSQGLAEVDIFETNNYEIVISARVKEMFEEYAISGIDFLPVDVEQKHRSMWQVIPLHIAKVMSPPTPLQGYGQCLHCKLPKVVALRTTREQLAPSNKRKVVEEEALLYLDGSSMAVSDLMRTDVEIGTLAERPGGAASFNPLDYPLRRARPLWVVSNKMLRVLDICHIAGWSARPAYVMQ